MVHSCSQNLNVYGCVSFRGNQSPKSYYPFGPGFRQESLSLSTLREFHKGGPNTDPKMVECCIYRPVTSATLHAVNSEECNRDQNELKEGVYLGAFLTSRF